MKALKPVVIHTSAKADLDEAMEFYESRERGLGLALQANIEEAITLIQKNPEAWPPHKRSGFRKHLIQRFPFVIFYMELPDRIWVAAIAHGSRRPAYWSRRRPEQEP